MCDRVVRGDLDRFRRAKFPDRGNIGATVAIEIGSAVITPIKRNAELTQGFQLLETTKATKIMIAGERVSTANRRYSIPNYFLHRPPATRPHAGVPLIECQDSVAIN